MEYDRNQIDTNWKFTPDIMTLNSIEEGYQCQKYCRCCPFPGAKCKPSEFRDPYRLLKLNYKEERNSHE